MPTALNLPKRDYGECMKRISDYVNVFQGNGKIDLPTPEGIAATWLFIKAQCGNTTPAAAYPFGKMTVCSYTGGYPTGYGNHRQNFCGDPMTIPGKVRGFSHLHASGTGGIGTYHNYALTAPIIGELSEMCEDLVSERASVGYYSAELSSGVKFEGTVTRDVALHRYSATSPLTLQIDFSHSGLLPELGDRYYDIPECVEVEIKSKSRVTAHLKNQGVDLYFAAECKDSRGAYLWKNYEKLGGESIAESECKSPIGAAFVCGDNAEMRLSISLVSREHAEELLDNAPLDFEAARRDTEDAWENYLSKIKIKTEDENLREIFYSNLYHSLIKPCCANGESFIYDREKNPDFCFDLATMWDMYKTALPLIFTLYPEESRSIVNTLLSVTEKEGKSPINLTLSRTTDFSLQARMLAEHSFADYSYRYECADRERMVDAALLDLSAQKDFLETGYTERFTHILDICEALYATADIAREIGREADAEHLLSIADSFTNAYDKETGMMDERSPYYEGDNYNYSFRLHKDMQRRIDLMGKEKFLEKLDELFGYTREAVKQSREPNVNPQIAGFHSFEGFNNESDMEAPFAYIYAGRHDKTAEILSSGMKYMFTKGRGGLPGNNDSGGLSSYYVWASLGIYPVTGQDKMLIGSPILDGAELILSNGKTFKITVYDNNSSHIYVKRVLLNGREITDYSFSVREMMQGGHLEIYKS